MAAGQGAFWVAADVAELDALETRLQVQEALRGAAHVQQLRTVLEPHALYSGRGLRISTVPHVALALGGSESRAATILRDGLGLAELPGALEAVECGLLTVEQSAVVVQQLAVLPLPARMAVWRRLQARLVQDGAPLPPARLTELLRRWVQEADPADAVARRRKAEQDRTVDYRRRGARTTTAPPTSAASTRSRTCCSAGTTPCRSDRRAAVPVAAAGRASRCHAAASWWCTSRSAARWAPPTRPQSWSATVRSRRTCCRTCSWPRGGYDPSGSTRTAP